MKRILKTSCFYLAAEVITKFAQTMVILGFAAVSTKSQYASFGLVFALHLLAYSLVYGGAIDALTAAKVRQPEVPVRLLMQPALFVTGRIVIVVMIGVVGLGSWYFIENKTEISIAAILAAATAGVAIGIVRNASTVTQFEGRHMAATTFRTGQSLLGYLFGAAAIVIFSTDPITAFFCGYALGVCTVCLIFIAKEAKVLPHATEAFESSLLLRDTITYLPPALFGWLFGYGFSWVIEFTGHSQDAIAEFTMALSVTFFCPIIMTAIYTTWSPQYASLLNEAGDVRRILLTLNNKIWHLPLIIIGTLGALMLVAWDQVINLAGSKMYVYRHLESSIALILIGYIFLSLHYVSATIFVTEQAGKLFSRASFIGNLIGIIAAAMMLFSPSHNIAIGYGLALILRGVFIAVIAKIRWSVQFPLLTILSAATLILLAFVAVEEDSFLLTMLLIVFIIALLITYSVQLRNTIDTTFATNFESTLNGKLNTSNE